MGAPREAGAVGWRALSLGPGLRAAGAGPLSTSVRDSSMRMAFLLILLIILVGAIGGFVYLGLYPPHPRVHNVDRTLNNDQFQTH